MKKLLSILLCLVMMVSLLAGCGTSSNPGNTPSNNPGSNPGNSSSGDEGKTPAQKVETVIMYSPFVGNNEDKDAVIAAINEITVPEIGVELKWEQFQIGQWFQQYSLFLSGSDEIDILFNFGSLSNPIAQGACMDVTDLVDEYGTGIKEVLGDYLVCGEVDGRLYGFIPNNLFSYTYGLVYRADIVRELGLEDQVAAVKTLADWEPILAAVKAAHPEMTPFVTAGGTSMYNFFYGDWDPLGDGIGVLMNGGETATVENLFETDHYMELCSTMSNWYQKGYTSKDIQTQTDSFTTLCSQDAAFSTLTAADFDTAYGNSTSTGKEIGVVMLAEPFSRTFSNGGYTIMANSKHPEAAVKLLNMMYTDSRIINLMSYGIEGVHYQVLENGVFSFMDGQHPGNCTYHDMLGNCCNKVLRGLWITENPDLHTGIIEHNANDKKSAALGFVFDSGSVINQITEINNVCEKYRHGIESGAMDAAETIPAFLQELKDAGIDVVIAEKQKQLNEWLSNQNK